MTTATSASAAFDKALIEATALAARIFESLANEEWPVGLNWGHVGDMTETVSQLRRISDRMFLEGEYAE